MNKQLSECEMQCLAWAIVSGRSLKSWAEAHGLNVRIVRESSRLPEVRELVAARRLPLAGKTATKLRKLSTPASDQLAGLSPSRSRDVGKFRAELALLKRRLDGSNHGGTAMRIADLETRMRLRENATHGQ